MGTEIIKNAYKIKVGRRRTQITTYQNLTLQTTHPVKENKPKKIKPSIPSDYAGFNYYNRMKKRRSEIRELCFNNFATPNVEMITLTFDQKQSPEKSFTDIGVAHREFKKFIQRVNNHYQDFCYVATFSRQNNGNWHYHVMCNFEKNIENKEIRRLWRNGLTYVSYIKTEDNFRDAMQYLIDNMDESSNELKGKHGLLHSTNLETDKVITSWRAEHESDFEEAFQRVDNAKRVILYETKNHLGIKGERINEETGEVFEVTIPDREINDALIDAGYESWDTVYTHLSSQADFSDKFSELKVATLKPKKFKRINISK